MSSSIKDELKKAGDRSRISSQPDKKNYAQSLSTLLAQRVANDLRRTYRGILPDPQGKGQESRARTAKGFKRLDVNYSTLELGLALGISIKTINFHDASSGRYTKNITRVDNELRAESADYHQRQPYAVMVALVFLPSDSCSDGGRGSSSFGHAVKVLRYRTGRTEPDDDPTLFEKIFVGIYDVEEKTFGEVGFFDVNDAPPRYGRPAKMLTFEDAINSINACYEARNRSTFVWADAGTDTEPPSGDEGDDED